MIKEKLSLLLKKVKFILASCWGASFGAQTNAKSHVKPFNPQKKPPQLELFLTHPSLFMLHGR